MGVFTQSGEMSFALRRAKAATLIQSNSKRFGVFAREHTLEAAFFVVHRKSYSQRSQRRSGSALRSHTKALAIPMAGDSASLRFVLCSLILKLESLQIRFIWNARTKDLAVWLVFVRGGKYARLRANTQYIHSFN